jgi:hypothetical protein
MSLLRIRPKCSPTQFLSNYIGRKILPWKM